MNGYQILMIVWLALTTVLFYITYKAYQRYQTLKQKAKYYQEVIKHEKRDWKRLKIRHDTLLPQYTNDILDYYDNYNIKIPKDIMEDISHQHFKSNKDLVNYIESQRQHWKLENSKKIDKKGVL